MLKWSKANAKTERLNESCWEIAKYLDGDGKYIVWTCCRAIRVRLRRRVFRKRLSVKMASGKSRTDPRMNSVVSRQVKRHNTPGCTISGKHNYDTLKQNQDDWPLMYLELWKSIPKDAGIVRIHVAGDFFNQNYLRAWIQLAYESPDCAVLRLYQKSEVLGCSQK